MFVEKIWKMQNIENAFEQFQKLFICFEKTLCYLCFFVNLSKKRIIFSKWLGKFVAMEKGYFENFLWISEQILEHEKHET